MNFPLAFTRSLLPLALTCLLLPSLEAAPPPVPANVRWIALPAEVMLIWDGSPEAVYYEVYRAELDRRWMPVDKHVPVPWFRDSDYTSRPCYYQVAAVNAAGEVAATEEI